MKFRATADRKALILAHFEESYNHERTQEEFKMNPKQRRVDVETENEIAKMINSAHKHRLFHLCLATSQSCSTFVDVDPDENNETDDFQGTMFAPIP